MMNKGKCINLLILLMVVMALIPENEAFFRRRRRRRRSPPPPPPPPPDTTNPTFTSCPGNLGNQYTTTSSRTVTWSTPTASDNSGSATVSRVSGQSSGSTFSVSNSQYNIQYRATDGAGNSATCDITFMVVGIRCSTLSAPSHGSVGCTNTNFISSLCTISCDLGYHVVGSKNRTCLQSGNTGYWNGSTTTCSRTTCNSLSAPEDGALSCTDGWYFGSSCSFSCNSGYTLQNSQPTLTCLQNGVWSSSEESMLCSDVQAPTITGCPVSQSVIAPPLEISAVVTWNTPTASDNSGESIPVIQEEGPVTESALQEGDHMIAFTATDSSGNKGTCTFTVTVSVVRCTGPSAELPLQVSCLHGNLRGSECTFSCSVGYLLQGPKASQCLLTGSDGMWDRETPTCQISQCEDPPLLENGGLKGDCSRDYSSTCYFECDVGYEINNGALTCLAQPDSTTVSWHGELPRCSRIYCTKPHLTIGLEITVSSDCPSGSQVPSGNHCQFVCSEGYHLQGNGDLMCQEDRTWSRAIPTCHLITCKVADIEIPMNALLEGCEVERVNYGKLCTLSCQEGYEATGLNKSTDMKCSGDGDDVGTWSGDSIKCNVVTCPAPIAEENGVTPFTVECSYNDEPTTLSDRQNYSTSCLFECVEGYSLVQGSSVRVCLASAEWDGTPVSCKDMMPPDLICPADVVLTAGRGLTSVEIPWSQWEPILAIDLGIHIEASLFSIDAKEVGEVRPSSLPEGSHTLVYRATDASENEADCSFSVTARVCRCAPLPIPENSIVALESGDGSCSTGVVYGSVCTIICEIGYELSTGDVSLSRTCDITDSDQSCDATWSGQNPVCEIIRCNTPSVTNGVLDCSPSTQPSVTYLTSCEFSCNPGYRTPSGEETRIRTCQADTTWSGEEFHCTEMITCPARFNMTYGSVEPSSCESYDSVSFHSTCTFTCETGFRLDGPITVECTPHGHWAPSGSSVCVDVQPPTFNVECPRQIEVDAPLKRTTAEVNLEEPIPKDNSGTVTLTRLGPTTGSEFAEGITNIRYEATDGSALTSFCNIIIIVNVHRCSALHPPLHGSMSGCDDPYIGSECSFSCERGYDLDGASSILCELLSDGIPAWNNDTPTCQIQTCPSLQIPAFASVSAGCVGLPVAFGTNCAFSCEPGFYGEGESTLICSEGGVWPSTDFVCERKSCEVLIEPASITILPEICLLDPRFGDVCTLECDQSGFKITPPHLRELACTSDQIWSGNTEESRCVDMQVPEFEDCPSHMVVFVNRSEDAAYVDLSLVAKDNDPQAGELVGSCNYHSGIMNAGEYDISCSAVDEAGNEALCQFILEVEARKCQTLNPPEHGFLLEECEIIHGSECLVACSQGYILVGSSGGTCEFDGSDNMFWHFEKEPVCRTTSCTPLSVPDEVIFSPSSCSGADMVPDGTVCTMSCDFLLTLDTDRQSFTCREGEWDHELDILSIQCRDNVPPTLTACPQSPLRVDRIEYLGVEVGFVTPTAIDNFDTELRVTTNPLDLKSPYNFTSDATCTYTFTDDAGNSVSCVFVIDITNKVKPIMTSCPLGGEVNATKSTTDVKYEHPSYSPIPGIDLVLSCDAPASPVTLPVGHHEITCSVSDPETGLQSECKMHFNVMYVNRCPPLYTPKNGALVCDTFASGQFCSILCEKGYDIPRTRRGLDMFICGSSGKWSPLNDVPDCLEKQSSRNILSKTMYYPSPCSEDGGSSTTSIARSFLDVLKASVFGFMCKDNAECSVENVKVSCGQKN